MSTTPARPSSVQGASACVFLVWCKLILLRPHPERPPGHDDCTVGGLVYYPEDSFAPRPSSHPGHDDYAVDEAELRGGIPDSGLMKLGDDLLYRVGQGVMSCQ